MSAHNAAHKGSLSLICLALLAGCAKEVQPSVSPQATTSNTTYPVPQWGGEPSGLAWLDNLDPFQDMRTIRRALNNKLAETDEVVRATGPDGEEYLLIGHYGLLSSRNDTSYRLFRMDGPEIPAFIAYFSNDYRVEHMSATRTGTPPGEVRIVMTTNSGDHVQTVLYKGKE